jgi:hypothetical protein
MFPKNIAPILSNRGYEIIVAAPIKGKNQQQEQSEAQRTEHNASRKPQLSYQGSILVTYTGVNPPTFTSHYQPR